MKQPKLEDRVEWRRWVTPRPLAAKPIHRWYVFPHSFTSELVHGLIEEWSLAAGDRILDPFVGAGTTALAAKEMGVPATGYDLSPLAVLAARVKLANYEAVSLRQRWRALRKRIEPSKWNGASREYPELVQMALPGKLLGAFDAIDRVIRESKASAAERDFFRLGLLATIPAFSRAIASGGWLRWVDRRSSTRTLLARFSAQVEGMLDDLEAAEPSTRRLWIAQKADARALPDQASTYSAVITSPPYPNRHDYTRVFGVELMFGFLDWQQTRRLRYQSIHSHPEAHPERPTADGYAQPKRLDRTVHKLEKLGEPSRVIGMLEGYFLDLFLVLRELKRVCRKKAPIALVVGNAQYRGEPVPVDELIAEVGEQAGLTCERLLVARYRGNSAQQMGKHGRNPSRESIVVFKKT